MASKKVASAYIDLQLQTAQFKAALGEATGSMRQFSAQTTAEMHKSREAVRLLNEDLGTGIPRGLQGIISKLPGVTTAMNLAFDAVVVFALLDVVVKTTQKVVEFATKNEEAAKKNDESWKQISKSVGGVNSELVISNARIQDSIAKLEHKPGDGLKTALLEAADAAQKLSEKLDQDIDKLLKLTTERKIGFLDELTGKGQEDLDRTIGYGAAQYRKIAPGYDDVRNRAAARGDWANYTQAGKDEVNALHAAIDLQLATLAEYLRKNQSLALTNPNDPEYAKAKNGYSVLSGLISAVENQSREEIGKHTQAGAQANKDASTLSKEALARRKAEAEARKTEFEASFTSRYNNTVPSAAAIMANPGTAANPGVLARWEGGRDKAEYSAIVDQLRDAGKNGLTEQDKEMYKVLLRTIAAKMDLQSALYTQRVATADQTAQKEYDTKTTEIMAQTANRTAEALRQLQGASDKAAEGLLKAQAADQEARAKYMFQSGQISQRAYQNILLYGMGGTQSHPTDGQSGLLAHQLSRNNDEESERRTKIIADTYDAQSKLIAAYNAYSLSLRGVPEEQRLRDGAFASFMADKGALEASQTQQLGSLPGIHRDEDAEAKQKFATAEFEADVAAFKTTAIGGVDAVFNEFIARSQDVGEQVHNIFGEALNGLNDTLIKVMTTRSYEHQHAFKEMGKSLFTSAAKTGLQDAEGQGMKFARSLPGPVGAIAKKLFHPKGDGYHMWIDNLSPGAGSGLSGLLKSGSSAASGAGEGLGGVLSAFASALIPMASGGLMSPGDFYITGEQGPEVLQVGSTSKINNARDTATMFSGGGGGGNTTHLAIDARGSNDPAATEAAVHRAMSGYLPHMGPLATAHLKNDARRTPARRQ